MVSGANARRNVEEGLKPEQEKSANKLKTTARPVDNNPWVKTEFAMFMTVQVSFNCFLLIGIRKKIC